MHYIIPRSNLCMSDPMPFNQHWEARVPLPIKDIDDIGTALHSAYASFRPGDLINICAFDSLRWNHLTEVAQFRISSTDNDKIVAVQIGEIAKVAKPAPKVAEVHPENLVVVPHNKAFEVRDERGNVIEQFVTKAQAEAFVAGESARAPAKKSKAA